MSYTAHFATQTPHIITSNVYRRGMQERTFIAETPLAPVAQSVSASYL